MSMQDIKTLKDTLEVELSNSSSVFIVSHTLPDFDAIGSALGLYAIAKNYNKRVYIILDDPERNLQPGIQKILAEVGSDYKFIKQEDLEKLCTKKSLLIVTDVNKKNMISIGDKLDLFKSIIVIDHHTENENTIDTEKSFIDLEVSSASEVVARLLNSYKIKYDSKLSNALLSGICLDTKRFKQNTSSKTHDVAEKLINNGADIDYVNSLFLEEFDSYCRISNLIINGTVIKKYSKSLLAPIQVSFTLNKNNPHQIYKKEDCAKAADQMMKFYGIDASFVLGYVDSNNVHISARGSKKVNVGSIMDKMGGGGNPGCAGAKIETDDILKLQEKLMRRIKYGISEEEDIIQEPQVIKEKRLKK